MDVDFRPWQCLNRSPLLALQPAFLCGNDADALFDILEREIPWDSPTLSLYGKTHVIPRAQCWMGDSELEYRYSGRTLQPTPWLDVVAALRDRLVASLEECGLASPAPNSVLLNRYAGGQQRMGWHSDDEPELGPDPVVVALSLGAQRPLRFRTRQRQNRHAFNVWLPHGSALLMGAGAQRHWQHAIAPRAIDGVRISLTFRHVYRDR